MDSDPLVTASSADISFQQVLGHDVERKLGIFKFLTCVFPVLWSPLAQYLNVMIGVSAAVFYMYAAVSPPSWVADICTDLHFPGSMKHLLMGSLVMINISQVSRIAVARSLLLSDDLRTILHDQTFIRKFALRGSYRCSFVFWAIVVGIVFLFILFPAEYPMMMAYMAPWLVFSYMASMPAYKVFDGIVDLSKHKAEVLCSKLEPRNEAGQSVDDKMKEPTFWCEITRDYLALDKQLEQIWSLRYGGALLLASCAVRFSFVMMFICCAAGAEQPGVIAFCVAGASATGITILRHLHPLAQVTALCQSQRANTRSIIRLAVEYVNHKDLNIEAQAAQSRFLQYVDRTPAGIEVPLLGVITESVLLGYAKAIVAIAPVALTYLLKAFGREGAN